MVDSSWELYYKLGFFIFQFKWEPLTYEIDHITNLLDQAEGYIRIFWIWFKFALFYDIYKIGIFKKKYSLFDPFYFLIFGESMQRGEKGTFTLWILLLIFDHFHGISWYNFSVKIIGEQDEFEELEEEPRNVIGV